MSKPNCYECEYRGPVPGDAHSCCNHPKIESPFVAALTFMLGYSDLEVKGSLHGIKNGWFLWPINFDPVWLENCNGFKPKKSN